jgi:superfamily II DNA or RNA helicase
MNINSVYRYKIYNLYKDLTDEDKLNFKSKINKVFEYYSCIKLTNEYNTPYYEYLDIPSTFKEQNNLSILDTGIDCSNLTDSIVQCKLRKEILSWKDCATFIAHKTSFNEETQEEYIRWKKCIITRNSNSELSKNLKYHKFRFIDKLYDLDELYKYCNNINLNEFDNTQIELFNYSNIQLRDYQIEAINIIKKQNNQNVIVKLPTGSGKNLIIIKSLESNNLKNKYLILVPRIVLMEQLKQLFIDYGYKNSLIQCIGNHNSKYNPDKLITICVYNSIDKVFDNINNFTKIYIDEAHHIYYPEIYKEYDDTEYDSDSDSNTEYDSDSNSDSDSNTESNTDSNTESNIEESYISKIRSLHSKNNLVYLSATIDPIDGDLYYEKSLEFMIDNNYLSDYQIAIPVFYEDPTDRNIAQYLLNNHFHIIIYCKSQEEGKKFNNLLNELCNNCSQYIDCNTKQKDRKEILDLFKDRKLRFLVNVKILTEGFDAPHTQGIMFLHLPTSRNTIIQCIGRALRNDDNKINAKIILPYSTEEDSNNLTKFINILSQVDSRCKKYKINITPIDKDDNENNDDIGNEEDNEETEINNLNFKCEQLFNNISLDRNRSWKMMLDKLEQYILENNKTPSKLDKNKEIKKLESWLSNQKINYKKEIKIMREVEIRKSWEDFINKYSEYFKDNNEIWYENLNKLEQYILENNKTPLSIDKDKEIKQLGRWLSHQKINYKTEIKIMKEFEIRKRWEDFIAKYSEHFKDNNEIWYENLNKLEQYILENNKTPPQNSKLQYSKPQNKEIKQIGYWLSTQNKNYKKEKYIMKEVEIRKRWKDFMNKYSEHFKDKNEIWYENLNKLEQYILENNKTPSKRDKNKEIKQFGVWLSQQKKNYKKEIQIMKEVEIRKQWDDFMDKYSKHFKNNNEIWYENLTKLEQYILENNKTPSERNKNKEIKQLGIWLSTQKINYNKKQYIMKEVEIRKRWGDFITKYSKHFKDNNEIWYEKLNKLEQYILENNKTPSDKSKDKEIKQLRTWLSDQKNNYNKEKYIMKEVEIRKSWEDFIAKYSEHFKDNNEIWYENLTKLENYILENNKTPSSRDKDKEIKQLGSWLQNQKNKYNKEKYIMKEVEIRKRWEDFINKYSKYFI